MNRRAFLGATVGGLAGATLLGKQKPAEPVRPKAKGPYSIEIVSPPEEAVRELPLFDSYKQAENFAQARMNILRQNEQLRCDAGGYINTIRDHETGLIKVWSSDSQVVFECAWGETWTTAYSYVDADGRSEAGSGFSGRL